MLLCKICPPTLFKKKWYLYFSKLILGLSTTVHFPGAKHTRPSPALDRDKDITGNLELGELGQLTITNDNESSYDVSIDQLLMLFFSLRKKYTFRINKVFRDKCNHLSL